MASRHPRHAPEFRLTVVPHFDTVRHRTVTRVVLETTQTFASFTYGISVEELREGSSITYRVLGLKAPGLALPSSGTARFQKDYEGLTGEHTFTVVGLDGAERRCTVAIDADGVREVSAPTRRGLILITGTSS